MFLLFTRAGCVLTLLCFFSFSGVCRRADVACGRVCRRCAMGGLCAKDVVQLVAKTVTQQRRSKGYGDKVQAYNSMIAERRKAHTKAQRKARKVS
jgi:hypothetical protein